MHAVAGARFVVIKLIIIMWITRVFVFVVITIVLVNAKKYESRCKLVRDLIRTGKRNDLFLGQWVCLIEKVSKRDTSAFIVTPSGKKMYGLYQIPNRWCREGKRGGDCNISCESLLDDDIRDDTACADLIFYREGFKYWPLWETRCKNDDTITKEIYKCPDLSMLNAGPGHMLRSDFLRYRRMLSARYARPVVRV